MLERRLISLWRACLLSLASAHMPWQLQRPESPARQLRTVLCARKRCDISDLAHTGMRRLRAQVAILLRTGAAPGPSADVRALHERLDALAQSLVQLGGKL
jgi:hypothetical protein